MVAAEFWIEETPRRPGWIPLAVGLGVGLVLGAAVAALAVPRLPAFRPEPQITRTWPHPALDREWRGIRTPVDVDRMFRRPR